MQRIPDDSAFLSPGSRSSVTGRLASTLLDSSAITIEEPHGVHA